MTEVKLRPDLRVKGPCLGLDSSSLGLGGLGGAWVGPGWEVWMGPGWEV